jgi:hypothetical protein
LTLQGLEARQLLSASIQVFNGSTQYSNYGYDSFGTVTVGASDSQTLTLKNVGTSTLTISSDSLPGGFSSSTSTPISISPNQSASFNVSLNTNSMGTYSGPLTLDTNDPNNSYFQLNLSGTVQQSSGGGTIELFDGSTQISNGGNDSFGSVTQGSSDTKSFTVDNVGSSTLTVSSVSLPSGYTLNTSLPLYVTPYNSSTLSVSLNTSTAGTYNGQMLVQSSDSSHNPFTVNLSGTVTSSGSPAIGLRDGSTTISNGGSDSFGSVTQGSSDTRTYTVNNQGGGTLTVSSISLPSGYSLQTSLPLNISSGNSTTFVVALTTSSVGTFSGTMGITSNSTQNNPFNVSLSGTVTAPAPVMSLADGSTTISNGGSDSFGSVTQGSSDNKTFTVKNTGTASLSVSAVSLPSGYSLQTSLPLSIAAGNSTTFVVALSTATVGTFSGTMSITDTDSNNDPYTVSLSGTVTTPPPAPAMSLADAGTNISNGGSDSFGSVTQGTSDTRTYTVKNTGNASLSVTAVSLPSGYSLQTSMPLTIAAGNSNTFVVALSTASVGTYSGTMSITDNDTNNDPYNVSLSGTVTTPPAGVNIQASVSSASEPAGTPGQFTVTRSTSSSSPLTVNYTVGGTATPGVDYTALSGSVTIAPNMPSATINVTPLTGGDVNEVQHIVLPAPTGGTYTLSINSDTTAALAYNASPTAIATALAGLPEVGAGRVTVTGSGTSASPFVVTFLGALGGANLPQITANGAQLTGGTSTGSGTGGITTSVTTVGEDGGTVVATLSSSSNYTVSSPSQGTVTVIGEEPPVVTVVATTPQAAEVAGTTGVFTLYRNGPTIAALTVNYSLAGSTLDGVDFNWVPGSVTFAVGQSTATVDITPINNGLPGPAKTVVLSLIAPQGQPAYALAGAASDTVTISDSNLPIVTVLATTPTANEETAAAGEFMVTRTGDLTNPLTVNYTVGGTAVAGTQYQTLSGSVTIPAGQGYATVDITPIDDGGEGTDTSSTVVLSLASSSSYQIGSANTDTVTIDDDDLPQVSIAASTPLAVESTAAPGAFTISLASPLASNLTVPYTVSGTAASGTDFQPLSGSATIPAGQTSVVVQVVPLNDPAEVGFTTVQANLSSGSGYELTTSKTAIVSIVGNMSVPTVTLSATTPVADVIAGTSGIFTVTRSGSTANALTAYYTIAGTAVDGTDYNLLPGSVTIPAGQASTTIIITPMSDPAMRDTSRTVTLNLTNYGGPGGAGYSIGNPAGDTVTIDDLPTVSIQATTATAQEHELTAGVFTVTRANDSLQATQALTVNYTIAGTAVNGTNYHTLSGSVTIPAGQLSATITVTPIDMDLMGGNQAVVLNLASGGYLISSTAGSATVTINDDDLPTVGIQATTPTASEMGNTPGVFTVTRNGPTTAPLTVSYSVSGTGVAGTNYQALSGSVTIPAGSATATINVTPLNVNEVGGTYTVVATLSAASGYWLTAVGPTPAPQTSGTVTIEENDLPTVTLQATQAHATESGTTGTFTVSRNGTTTNPLTVLYTIGGTAANGTDYQTLTGNVTIPAGQSTTTITVTPINDPNVEQDQSVTLTLGATSQYVAGSEYSGSVTIFDDNLPSVTVAAAANAVEQPATPGAFTVTRVGAADNPLTVSYTVSGTAAGGTDYSALPGTVTIPAGQSTATIDVTPLVDTGPETQQIVIPSATGGTYTLSLTSETDSPQGTVETTNTTQALAYNASASAVQAALALLPEVGTGNVTVTGQGTAANPFMVEFVGGLVGVNVPQIAGNASQLTGTTGVSVTTTTAGQRGFDQVEQVGFTASSNITGGTFTLSYLGHTTAALAYNASAATVQSAVQALPGIGSGNVAVTTLSTGPDTFTWQITFQGSLADAEVGQVTANPGSITVSSGSASADNSIITYGSSQGGIDAVQQVTVNGGVGGTFTLTYQGATTAAIAYNASAQTVQTDLWALSTIGTENVSVSGNAGGPWSVTFQGNLADESVSNLTGNSSGLVAPSITTSVTAEADGQRTVVVTLSTESTYTIGTLTTPTASGGTGAGDTVTITDPGNNLAPTAIATSYTTNTGQALSESVPGVLGGSQDPNSSATLTAVLLTGPADGTLTLNSNGTFTYTPAAGFSGTDSFYFQAFDGSRYSVPEEATIDVAPLPAPQISVADGQTSVASGGSVAFGQTYVGTAVAQTFTISNPGTATLDLSSWTAPSGFAIVTAPAATVAAGGSTTMTVQMNASTAGSFSGTFSINDNVSGQSPYTFSLSGTVVTPASALEVLQGATSLAGGGSFSYGTTGQGEPLTDTFTVKNVGVANLVLSDPIHLPTGFTLAQDFGTTTLAPGATTTFAVELTASATGSFSGNLSFGSNDPNNATYNLTLSGTVVASPVVEVLDGTTVIANRSSSPVNFGTALAGTALAQTFKIENNGTTTLSLNTSQLTLPTGYSVATSYATSVAPNSFTTLVLEINGSTAGTFSGTVSFPTNDVDNATFSFPVTGTINTPQPQIEVFDGTTQITPGTGSLAVGTTPLGTAVDVTLTIKNVGTADLDLNPVVPLPMGYRLVSLGETDVPAGSSTSAVLELVAGAAGTYSGNAEIDSNDPTNRAFDFTVSGTVVVPQAAITLGSTPVGDGESGAPPAGSINAVNFGDTTLNTPVVDTFTVTNAGQAALVLTDPIQVPIGFSVESDFGTTTLASGASTTFAVELDAQTAGQYQGTVIVETNDPGHRLYRFSVSGGVAAATMTVTDGSTTIADCGAGVPPAGSIADDDFGNTPVGTPVERTFTVKDTGTGVLTLSDPISLPIGFSLVSDFGSTTLQPGASTTFSVKLAATAAGFYGGNISFGTNSLTLPGDGGSSTAGPQFSFGVSGGVAVARLDTLEGTTDVTSYDTGEGSNGTGSAPAIDFGETVVGTARSETFTVKNTGTANLVLSDPISLPTGFTLTQDFSATTLAPGASTTFMVALSASAAGDAAGSISFGTNLSPLPAGEGGPNPPAGTVGPTFSVPIQGEVIGLSDFRLWNDTGYSSTDGHTSDPTVAGNLVGVPLGTTAQVQFQINNDGNVDGSVESDGTLPFTYTPPGLTPGAVTIDARVHLVDAVLGNIFSSWMPLSFTLETGTDAAPVVTNLGLQTVSVPNASTPTSSVPNISGQVLHDGNVAFMTVEVDTTHSGQANDTVTTDANGNFVYQPQNLAPGTYTFNFRAVEDAYPSGQIAGPWEPFTFTVVTPNPPVVDKLSLADVTGPGTSTTTDPTLTGHVTADGAPQQVEVDFNYSGDGTVDDSRMANSDGTFTFTPQNRPGGSLTIWVRAVNVDDNIVGAWTTINFTLLTTQPPTVNTLGLANVTGAAGSNTTDDPTVTGTLAAALGMPASSVADVTVEFDTVGDGTPDGSTVSDSNGNFTWTPMGIEPGQVTIAARTVMTDANTGAELTSAWKSITFTYSTGAGPVVSSLSLTHPTGTDQTSGLQTAIDPTLSGTLSDGSALASFLTVQYERNGDTTPDGSSRTDAEGKFTLTPTGLSPGTVTIEVRGVTQDPVTGAEVDGAWTTITFELQQDNNGVAPTPPSVTDNLTSADQIAATVQQGAKQSVDDGLASFNGALGAGSTASGQIALGLGTYTALSGDYGGRVVTGSIYASQNGSIPAPVQCGSGGSSGPSLPSSGQVGLPSGTPITLPANFSTPQTASVTLTNQPVRGSGSVGPGAANTAGTYGGSYTASSHVDSQNSNVTDWTIDVEFSYSYTNSLSGDFTEDSGTGFTYGGTVSGSYFYHYHMVGTTTVTPGGTIYGATFTIDESDDYGYSWTDTAISDDTTAGQIANDTETSGSSGSSSFSHHEIGSSSNGGGLAGGSSNGGYSPPTLSSNFTNTETDSYETSDGDASGFDDGSPTGGDVGGGGHNDSTSYTHNYFEQGTYGASSAGWWVDATFDDKESGLNTSSDTQSDNQSDAVNGGQVNGGVNTGDSLSDSFTNTETGTYSTGSGPYTLNAAFHYHEQGSETGYDDEQGNDSTNMSGMSQGGSYTYKASDQSSYSFDDQGTNTVGSSGTTISGTTTYQDSASETSTYQDGGGYGGTGVGPGSPGSLGPNPSPNPPTLTGTYSDDETDEAGETDSLSGTYTTTNSNTTDAGWESASASASGSYSSSGTDGQNSSGQSGGTSQSGGDGWQETADDATTTTLSGSYSNTPTSSSESGSYSDTEIAHITATDTGTTTNDSPGSWTTLTETDSTTTTYYYQDTGTYTVSNGVETDTGSYKDTTLDSEIDTAGNQNGTGLSLSGSTPGMGTLTSSSGDNYSESDSASETSSYSESASYVSGVNGSTSGTFSTSNSETSTYDFTDVGSQGNSQIGNNGAEDYSYGSVSNYSTNGYGSANGAYIDQGSFSAPYGNSGTTSTSFSETGRTFDSETGIGWGTYTNINQSGGYLNTAFDSTTDDGGETGWHQEAATNTGSNSFSNSTSTTAGSTQSDGGDYVGATAGTYSDYAVENQTSTGWQSGSTVTGTGITSSGTFGDDEVTLSADGGTYSSNPNIPTANLYPQVPGGIRYFGTADGDDSDQSSMSFYDDGSFNATNGGQQSQTASFNRSTSEACTSDESENGPFYLYGGSGTYNGSGQETDLSSASESGSYTNVPGNYTETGSMRADSLTTGDSGEQQSAGSTTADSHSDSSTGDSTTSIHETGTYTAVGPSPIFSLTTASDIQYTQDSTTSGDADSNDTTLQALLGFEASAGSNNDFTSYHASGTSALASGTTTDTASYTSYQQETDTGTDDLNGPYAGSAGLETTNTAANQTTDYYETGTYTKVQGAQTAQSASFYSETSQGASQTKGDSGDVPDDPATSWTETTLTALTKDDTQTGSKTLANNALTTSTDDYLTTTSVSTTRTFNESSDEWEPEAEGVAWGDWNDIPNFFEEEHIASAINPHGAQATGPAAPSFPTVSSTARISETAITTSSVTGATTDTAGGNPSTNSNFSTTNSDDDFAYLQAVAPAGFNPNQPSGGAGYLMTDSAQYNDNDSTNGTNTGGVVQENYNNVASESASYSTFITSDVTAGPDDPLYQETDWRSTTTSLTDSGSYTTSNIPPGSPGYIPTTTSNPGGWTRFNETHNEDVSVSNTVSLIDTAGEGGAYNLAYSGTAVYSTTSNRTVTVDVPNNINSQSGSYNTTGNKAEWSTLEGTGSAGGPAFGQSWKFKDFLNTGRSLEDSGTYPSGGNSEASSGSAQGWTETVTYWQNSPGFAWTSTATSSGDSSENNGTTGSDGGGPDQSYDDGTSPPPGTYEDQDTVPYTVATVPYDVTPFVSRSAWDGYWWNVALTAKGYFINAPIAMVKGLAMMAWQTISDPVGTTIGQIQFAGQAIMHPLNTFNAIKTEFWDRRAQTPEGQGAIAFDIALTFVTSGEAIASQAGKLGILGRGASIAGEAGELGGAGRFLAGHNEYVIADAAKAARVKEVLMGFFTRNSPNPVIKWVRDLVVDGVKRDAVLDTVTGEILIEEALKDAKYAHLVEGYLIEELQHFHQVFTKGLFGRALTAAEQSLLESEVVQRILKSGFQIFLGM